MWLEKGHLHDPVWLKMTFRLILNINLDIVRGLKMLCLFPEFPNGGSVLIWSAVSKQVEFIRVKTSYYKPHRNNELRNQQKKQAFNHTGTETTWTFAALFQGFWRLPDIATSQKRNFHSESHIESFIPFVINGN